MRILIITNYYPPSDYGWGYMQLCEEVADGIAARGHDIAVLTSTYRDGAEPQRPYPVFRLLTIEPDWNKRMPAAWQFFVGRRRRERKAVAHLQRLVGEFRPDMIFIWHAIGLPRVLLQAAEHLRNIPTVYYLAGYLPELPDEYIAYWRSDGVRPLARLLKRPLARVALRILAAEGKPISLRYPHVICVSEYVRRRLVSQGLIPESAVVIHNGVDLSQFSPDVAARQFNSNPMRCLIAGRVVPEKGIHTAIEAIAELPEEYASRVRLTILGDGPRGYKQQLEALVEQHRLQRSVTFRPPVPRGQMPDVLAGHDVLILPSEYAEPIARSMQEAMAMGLLVIGTTTGGSGELLAHEETGLVFEAGDPHSLANQLERVLQNPAEAAGWARAGQRAVQEHFDIRRTVEQVEKYLVSQIGD